MFSTRDQKVYYAAGVVTTPVARYVAFPIVRWAYRGIRGMITGKKQEPVYVDSNVDSTAHAVKRAAK